MTNEEYERLQETYALLRECKKRAETIETFKTDIAALRLANSGIAGSGQNVTGIRSQRVEFDNITYVHAISEYEKKIVKAGEENNKIVSEIFEAVYDSCGVSILMKYYFEPHSSIDSVAYDIMRKFDISKTTFNKRKKEAVIALMHYRQKHGSDT